MRFQGTLELHGKTATGVQVPDAVVTALGSSRRPAVTVTVNAHSWRTSVANMGGVFLRGISAENRAAAHVGAETSSTSSSSSTQPSAPSPCRRTSPQPWMPNRVLGQHSRCCRAATAEAS